VSRVLNSSAAVSEDTRHKVLEAIEELDFTPNLVARQLSTGEQTLSIGIIAPFFTRPAFVGRLRGIEAVLARSDFDLILYNVETAEQRDKLLRKLPDERRVDGLLIIAFYPDDEDVAHFKRRDMPVVVLDANHPELSSVLIDDLDGGRKATDHLIGLGHRRIAYLRDDLHSPFGFRASRKRFEGYQSSLHKHGLPLKEAYHQSSADRAEDTAQITANLTRLEEPPSAIFAASDTQAFGVIEALDQNGLSVPEDISVIGYDDIETANYVGLTTIRQPLYESGILAAEMMISLIENPTAPPNTVTLPVELVVRKTTAPAPSRARESVKVGG
jgi:DNA-binding LacI/PurR family transcriptional regulator